MDERGWPQDSWPVLRRLLLLGVLAVLPFGCAVAPGQPQPTEGPATQTTGPASFEASPARSPEASISATSPLGTTAPYPTFQPIAFPSNVPISHESPELEAVLPAALGGVPTVRFSRPARDFVGGDMCLFPLCGDELPAIVKQLGKSLDDAEVAMGFAPGGPAVWLIAISVRGATSQQLIAARLAAAKPVLAPSVAVGEKTVRWEFFLPVDSSIGADYIYAHQGVLFLVKYGPTFGAGTLQIPPPTPPEVVIAISGLP